MLLPHCSRDTRREGIELASEVLHVLGGCWKLQFVVTVHNLEDGLPSGVPSHSDVEPSAEAFLKAIPNELSVSDSADMIGTEAVPCQIYLNRFFGSLNAGFLDGTFFDLEHFFWIRFVIFLIPDFDPVAASILL